MLQEPPNVDQLHVAAEGSFCRKVCNLCQDYFRNKVGCEDGVEYMTDNRILSDMRVLQLYSVIVLDASQHQRTMLRNAKAGRQELEQSLSRRRSNQ
ncbi:hypothetical protein Prudu_003623 [Prunus dulcis]|uniref:Uncharacterized protein n=1 Tax=Prunus dulcis TaxID=3755 RepID=A0A4Y1QTK8_PRUDU|nr:hypothetical protein Prudu_003623 [Prunus dulcis]